MDTTALIQKLHSGGFALTRPATTVSFLRHANAIAADGGHDSNRLISDKGRKQCAVMRETHTRFMKFNAIYRSPLPRVDQTLMGLGIDTGDAVIIPQLVIESGLETHQCGVIDAAYEILGGVGLASIMKYKEVAYAMDVYAATALEALYEQFEALPQWTVAVPVAKEWGPARFHVIAAGHGWFNPLLAYYLAGSNEVAKRHLLQHAMGECEIIQVGVNDTGEPHWERFACPSV
ncbi:MAG TPA: hypothetical protein VI981_00860 [Candidatus Paceibacterota bacterium]